MDCETPPTVNLSHSTLLLFLLFFLPFVTIINVLFVAFSGSAEHWPNESGAICFGAKIMQKRSHRQNDTLVAESDHARSGDPGQAVVTVSDRPFPGRKRTAHGDAAHDDTNPAGPLWLRREPLSILYAEHAFRTGRNSPDHAEPA